MIKKGEFNYPSTVKGESIFVRYFSPDSRANIKAVLQIVHGMAEHSMLYSEFGEFMAENGFLVVASDHLGHGRSVKSGEDYGHFFEGGINNAVNDVEKLFYIVKKEMPELPYFVLGHSMGSFITRKFISIHGEEINGVVIMGTSAGLKPVAWAMQKLVLKTMIAKNGPKAKHKRITHMATAAYTKRFPQGPNHWVTSDEKEIERFTNDPMCGFGLTLSAYYSVGELLQEINKPEWYQKVPANLPILIMSGKEDPVGDMGIGVRKVASNLAKTSHDVDIVLYQDVRHALITEVNKEDVFKRILSFYEVQEEKYKISKQ